jgi:predicted RNase H-like HicB family nuclease
MGEGLPPRAPAIAQTTVSEQERSSPGTTEAEPVAPPEFDEATGTTLANAMRDLEEAWQLLHNAAKRLHTAGVGSPLHQNVSLLADDVRQEEARLSDYITGSSE